MNAKTETPFTGNKTDQTLSEIEQLRAQLRTEQEARIKAEAAAEAATKAAQRKLTFKVGAKGGVSLYGINAKFPVTLYVEQWRKVLSLQAEFEAFLAAAGYSETVAGDGTRTYSKAWSDAMAQAAANQKTN